MIFFLSIKVNHFCEPSLFIFQLSLNIHHALKGLQLFLIAK